MAETLGPNRLAAICRELTKKFETVLRAPLQDLITEIAANKNQTRGEFVVIVEGHEGNEDEALANAEAMSKALLEYLPASQAARVAAKLNDVSRRDVYKLLETED